MKAIIENKNIGIKIDEDNIDKTVQTFHELKNESEKENQEYLNLTSFYYREDVENTRYNYQEKIKTLIKSAKDEEETDLKIDNKPNIQRHVYR